MVSLTPEHNSTWCHSLCGTLNESKRAIYQSFWVFVDFMGNQRCIFFQPIIKWVKIECKQLHYNDDNKNRAINSSYAHQNSRYDILIIPFTFIIVLCWVICDYFVLFYFFFFIFTARLLLRRWIGCGNRGYIVVITNTDRCCRHRSG